MITILEHYYNKRDIGVLRDKKIVDIQGLYTDSTEVVFRCSDGTAYKMYHRQDADEDVYIRRIYVNSYLLSFVADNETGALEILNNNVIDMTHESYTEYSDTLHVQVPDGETIDIDGSSSVTAFKLITYAGIVGIVWRGVAFRDDVSTEVSFEQIEGDGLWVDTKAN